ncbi:MAG: glycosyltransferase, partial [Syntrophales bacterium]
MEENLEKRTRAKNKRKSAISLCMIVKNEEACLGRCLKSVCDHVDEIIIVDTGSTDGT